MSLKKITLIFLLSLNIFKSCYAKSAVSYTFSGGRFGDCLIAYCHAYWIAYTLDLDFIYRPFKYSDQLLMDQTDTLYSEQLLKKYKQTLHINHALQHGVYDDTLYIVPFFCESHVEHNDPRCPFLFQVDWKNDGFISELKKRIAPKYLMQMPELCLDAINIAVHVRKGTGWDIPQFAPTFEKLTEMHPLKWPPDSYYIGQIKKISELFPTKKLCIYLFTDHDKPLDIIEKYKQIINDSRIQWRCREIANRQDLNVLEDFFALTRFDCLIRNDSNFSIIASKLGSYQIMIGPWDSRKTINGDIEICSICFEDSDKSEILTIN